MSLDRKYLFEARPAVAENVINDLAQPQNVVLDDERAEEHPHID